MFSQGKEYDNHNPGRKGGRVMYDPTVTNTTGASTCGYKPYINDCIHRLPCGLCAIHHMFCPLANVGAPIINWNEVTCQMADKGAEDG